MPLYRINKDLTVEKVKISQFNSEKEIQKLVEKNIENFFGMRLLESEYSIPNGRMDSLCIDENGIPVVIEYKKKKDLSAIIQGLFYVDWLKTNRRTFEMIVREKVGKDTEVDWKILPGLLIIAEEFDQKELSAINQINASVELVKYSYYGELVSFESLNLSKRVTSIPEPTKPQTEQLINSEDISIENVLAKGTERIKDIILNIRDWIFELSDEINEAVKPSMLCYKSNGKGLVWLQPIKKRFKIYLRKGEYSDNLNLGWGGYPELNIGEDQWDDKMFEYVKVVISQAYEN
jgi:hypothetical protein